MHLKFFVTLISLAKTNLFSLQILHLFILSFPMTKVSGPSNIFSINTLLGNLALKRYFVQPNQYLHTISFHSAVITTNKLVAQLWVLKRRYIDDCIGATSSTRGWTIGSFPNGWIYLRCTRRENVLYFLPSRTAWTLQYSVKRTI